MMWSERHGNEIYVFHNGELVYKRWLDDRGRKRQASLLANKGWPPVWIAPVKNDDDRLILRGPQCRGIA